MRPQEHSNPYTCSNIYPKHGSVYLQSDQMLLTRCTKYEATTLQDIIIIINFVWIWRQCLLTARDGFIVQRWAFSLNIGFLTVWLGGRIGRGLGTDALIRFIIIYFKSESKLNAISNWDALRSRSPIPRFYGHVSCWNRCVAYVCSHSGVDSQIDRLSAKPRISLCDVAELSSYFNFSGEN